MTQVRKVRLWTTFFAVAAIGLLCGLVVLVIAVMKHEEDEGDTLRHVHVDTDVGIDDLGAFGLLMQEGSLALASLTTVGGLSTPTVGASILDAIGLRTESALLRAPVVGRNETMQGNKSFPWTWRDEAMRHVGIPLPFATSTPEVPAVDGGDGDGEDAESAAAALVRKARELKGKLTLLGLGPLTNIARALELSGKDGGDGVLDEMVKELVWSGGGINVKGNGTPGNVSEWNAYVDSYAAKAIFQSNMSITLFPLDVSSIYQVTAPFVNSIWAVQAQSESARILREVLTHVASWRAPTPFDIITVAYLLNEDMFTFEYMDLVIDDSGANDGATIVVPDGQGKRVKVAMDVNIAALQNLLYMKVSAGVAQTAIRPQS